MPDTRTVRRRNLPMIVLSLIPALFLGACNTQEKQELTAAIARAEEAASRAESAQHTAEAAAARARSDKLAAARDAAAPVEETNTASDPGANQGQAPEQSQGSLPGTGSPG